MDKKILSTAAILGAAAIVFGAFGAHALKKVLAVDALAAFETGVRYTMYHALFLLFIGISGSVTAKAKKAIYYLALSGVVFFSGSIYLLATGTLTSIDFKIIGFVTPIGGLLLILAWIWLFADILKKKS